MKINEELKSNLIADVKNICKCCLTNEEKEMLKRCFEITIGTHEPSFNEEKTTSGFTVVKTVEIPFDYLTLNIKKELQGRETHSELDCFTKDAFFCSDVFETILCEQSELSNDSFMKLPKKDLIQLETISNEVLEYDLVRVVSY